MELGNVMERF